MLKTVRCKTSEAGGCSACNARPEEVNRISAGEEHCTFSLRLCDSCRDALVASLAGQPEHPVKAVLLNVFTKERVSMQDTDWNRAGKRLVGFTFAEQQIVAEYCGYEGVVEGL